MKIKHHEEKKAFDKHIDNLYGEYKNKPLEEDRKFQEIKGYDLVQFDAEFEEDKACDRCKERHIKRCRQREMCITQGSWVTIANVVRYFIRRY